MPLSELIPSLIDENENFAYFCKFDDLNRIRGTEVLFQSNADPLMMKTSDEIGRFFNRIKDLEDGISVPLVVSFDFIEENFRGVKFMKSKWPAVMALLPEKTTKGTYLRDMNRDRRILTSQNLEDEKLERIISGLRDRIRQGELLQVVISRDFQLPAFDPVKCLMEFLEFDRSVYVYYYKFGEYQIIGSSPENLVTMIGNKLIVDPIAGTARRGNTVEDDELLGKKLREDPKELSEHRMLVDLARNDLARISLPGSVRVERNMEIGKFGNVQHLVSRVSSTAENNDKLNVIRSVFPAGTVSGSPKRRALELIGQFEDTPRGAYSGCLGIAGNDGMDLALLIRSVYSSGDGYYTRSGAGIVNNSVPEREVQEIFTKSLNVMEIEKIESFND